MPRSCTYLIEGRELTIEMLQAWHEQFIAYTSHACSLPDAGAEVVNGYYVQKEGQMLVAGARETAHGLKVS